MTSTKADGAGARCVVRSDCFAATSTGTGDIIFDLDTYIHEANASIGLAINPYEVLTKSTRGKRQSPTPVLMGRILSSDNAYGHKPTKWCKADKPHYPWMASLSVLDGGTEASTQRRHMSRSRLTHTATRLTGSIRKVMKPTFDMAL